jgi:hypothetical protein
MYSKWQRLDVVDTLKKFFMFERESNNTQSSFPASMVGKQY